MTIVRRWTGREAKLLRQALRLSVRDFAARLGIGLRTINKWEARQSDITPLPHMQEVLDTALVRASDEAKARFAAATRADVPETAQVPALPLRGARLPVVVHGRLMFVPFDAETGASSGLSALLGELENTIGAAGDSAIAPGERVQKQGVTAGGLSELGLDEAAARCRRFAPAVHTALLRARPACDSDLEGEPNLDELEVQILDALSVRSQLTHTNPLLVMVGGFAGSGKTEFGKFLSGLTGWSFLDKDVLTRPLVESILLSRHADPNDRHSPVYLEHVRPLEYRCLMNAAFNNLDNGISSVVAAPFLMEMADTSWLSRVASHCQAGDIDLVMIWIDTDVESMFSYLQVRDAARDTWKLTHWDDYVNNIDMKLRPRCPHFVVDNRQNAAITLVEQAHRLAGLVRDEA